MPNHVFFLGDSIMMASVAASLACFPEIRVTCLDQVGLDSALESGSLGDHPVIVYDKSLEPLGQILELINRAVNLILIGVDPEAQNILVISGQNSALVEMKQLAGIIRNNCQ